MARRPSGGPTEAELEILRVLWDRGPCTVRQVHEALTNSAAGLEPRRAGANGASGAAPRRATGYTTTLKLMQIMAGKGLVRRDERQRTHVYVARLKEGDTQKRLVGQLLDRLFAGSAGKLVLNALQAGRLSAKELAEIRQAIERLQKQELQRKE